MGLIYQGVHKPIVQQILQCFDVDTFVETGTYEGETAHWASQYFKNVYTIEKSISLRENAKNRFKNVNNIDFLCGDSRDVLVEISPKLTSPTLFWLDAHWSLGETYGEDDECALLGELDVILTMNQDHFVLVDDARLFFSPPPHPLSPNYWPHITQILNLIEQAGRYYTVILDDVIVMCPNEAKPIMVEFYQNYVTEQWESIKGTQSPPWVWQCVSTWMRKFRSFVRKH